jgi:hypothetical protein
LGRGGIKRFRIAKAFVWSESLFHVFDPKMKEQKQNLAKNQPKFGKVAGKMKFA